MLPLLSSGRGFIGILFLSCCLCPSWWRELVSFGSQPRRELGKQRTFVFSLLFMLNSSSCIFNGYNYLEISKDTESWYRSLICVFKGKVKNWTAVSEIHYFKNRTSCTTHSIKVLSLSSPRTSSIYSGFKNWLLHSYIKVSSILIFLIFFLSLFFSSLRIHLVKACRVKRFLLGNYYLAWFLPLLILSR